MDKAITKIMDAYADCNDRGIEKRNLAFFCDHAFNGNELAELMAKAVPGGYNAFNEETLETVIATFGRESKYYVAREGSVCIYIKPTEFNVWFSRNVNYAQLADEVMYCPEKQMFRIWWD